MAEDEAVQRGAARYVARALALALIAGGLLATLGGNGFARMLHGAEGYAAFDGYVPEKCVTSTQYARAINGDVIRVCQHVDNLTYGFFSGHDWRPLGDSDTTLHVALPDAGKHFSWYDPYGDSDWFGPATLDPVVPGNPASGSAHFAAVAGPTKYLDVVQTAKVAAGSSAYTLTWSITNRTAAPQRVRPMVATTGFGWWGKPSFGSTQAPLSVTVRNPELGGAITLGGATPVATSFTTGGTQHRIDASKPSAPALDNIQHDDGFPSHESEIALAWDIKTLAPNETADYSVTVTLARAREVQLRARGVPTASAPTTIDATVYDERGFAGKQLVWSTGYAGGKATIGADGKAVFSVPGRGGAQRIDVWADIDGDGGFKGDEPLSWASCTRRGRLATADPDPGRPGPPDRDAVASAPRDRCHCATGRELAVAAAVQPQPEVQAVAEDEGVPRVGDGRDPRRQEGPAAQVGQARRKSCAVTTTFSVPAHRARLRQHADRGDHAAEAQSLPEDDEVHGRGAAGASLQQVTASAQSRDWARIA